MTLTKHNIVAVCVLFFLAAIAALASYNRWSYDYTSSSFEYCPDGYCEYSGIFKTFLEERTPESFRNLQHEFREFTHSSSMLGPVFIGFAMLFNSDVIQGYLLLSGLASIGTLLLLMYHLRKRQVKHIHDIWIITPFLLFNFVFLRGFTRPITDALGMFAVFAILILVEKLIENFSLKNAVYMGGIYFILLFSRISTLFIIPFISLWNAFLYVRYQRKKYLEIVLLWGIGVPFLFLLTLLSLESAVSILRNTTQATLPVFTVFHNLKWFSAMVALGVHILPILWIATIKKLISNQSYTLHIAWISFYLFMLVVGGGAFWSRYMAPVIPSIIYITAPGLLHIYKQNRFIFWAFCFVYIISNMFALVLRIYFPNVVFFGKNFTELTY